MPLRSAPDPQKLHNNIRTWSLRSGNMGGDHKCPVCSATFTRPQHVVRHMRSHTGDRPYKCQQCGDQFSRSDLLSRHVNKCHIAGSGSAGVARGHAPTGRRKGLGANASRATTSKQACDQCVQSSLPCDGSNPCAKCIQRKIRCTFVKFHRQTAPIGPGHNPSRVPSSILNSNSASSSSPPVPPPVPFSRATFGGFYDVPAGGYADGEALMLHPPPSAPASNSISYIANHHRVQQQHQQQQQADLQRRASFPSFPVVSGQPWINGWHDSPHGTSPVPFDTGVGQFAFNVGGGDYRDHQFTFQPPQPPQHVFHQQHPHAHPHAASSTSLHSSSSSSYDSPHYEHRSRPGTASDTSDISRPGTSSSFASSRPSTSQGSQSESGHSQSQGPSGENTGTGNAGFSSAFGLLSLDDPAVLAGLANDGAEFFSHLGAADGHQHPNPNGDDTGHPQGVIHLADGGVVDLGSIGLLRNSNDPDATPMPMGEEQAMGLVGPEHTNPISGSSGSSPIPPSTSSSPHPNQQQNSHPHQFPPTPRAKPNTGHGYGRHLNNNNPPHNSNSHSTDMDMGLVGIGTPTHGAVGTPTRDIETRELREFWKAYMRTPGPGGAQSPGMHGIDISGHGHGILLPLAAPPQSHSPPSGNGNGTETVAGVNPGYRRPRVSSLPSVKTPPAFNDEDRFGYSVGGGFVGFNGAYNVGGAGYPSQLIPGSRNPGHHPSLSQQYPLQPGLPSQPPPPQHGGTGMTVHGNAEDLRSYEAAVLDRARKAPVNLSMQGKMMRRNKPTMSGNDSSGGAGGAASSPSPSTSSSMSSSPAIPQMLSAPSTSSDADTGTENRLSHTPESTSFTSGEEESSTSSGTGEASGPVPRRSSRPSFKRLASQVLEKGGSGKVARV